MSRPVTEIVVLSFHPDINPKETITSLENILAEQEGFRSLRWGHWDEDETKVQLTINWDDISYHRRFEQSGADFEAGDLILRPVITSPPAIFHVYLDQAALNKILDTPVVELATFYSVPADFATRAETFFDLLALNGCSGIVHADVVEEIALDDEKEESKAYFAALAWSSIEEHIEVVQQEIVQQHTGLIIGEGRGQKIEMHHVRFDCFNVRGYDSTLGFVSFIGRKAEANAPLVDILLELGAVIYVKTNIPQTLMSADSDNNVFGRVLNPHNISPTAGGSSGGEGALIAMRGSILGIGTDIAGSIRIPALCCGTFGFKPTAGRIPFAGQTSAERNGSPGIQASAGPLATSFRDLRLLMQTVLDAQPWDRDPAVLPVAWRSVQKHGRLTIGIISEVSNYPLRPPVRRAIKEATTILSKAGHTVTVLQATPSILEAGMLAFKLLTLDNTRTALRHIQASGEPPIRSLAGSVPDLTGPQSTLEDLFDFNAKKADIAARWHQVWLDNQLDAIIMPGHSNTASPHDTYGQPPCTLLWNLIDWPACIIPYGKVDRSLDEVDGYDTNLHIEAPCAIQVVGRRFQDEQLLAVTDIIRGDLAK